MRTLIDSTWSRPAVGLGIAAMIAVAAGLLVAWLTPRGPVDGTEALVSMAAALVVGVLAGLAMGSRWSALLAPMVFVVVFELARLPVSGATVDTLTLGTMYGIIAFVVGRGVHAALVLLPMTLGADWGHRLSIQLRGGSLGVGGFGGWVLTGVGTLAVVALAIVVGRPAAVAPFVGANGEPVSGSIAEIFSVRLGGIEQTIMIRARSEDAPVILYLAGGPGGTDLGAMRGDTALEQEFVVVTWEQRGTGKSYGALDPVDTLTPEQMIADTVELTDYLRERFGEDKIYLTGNSWGTLLGVMTAQRHPELFHAFVGTGQMVSPLQTDTMFREDTIAWAREQGDTELVAELERIGPPPYEDLLDYETALSHEHDFNPYPYLEVNKEMPSNLFVPENTLMDRINGFRGFLDTFAVLYPQIQDVDLRKDARRMSLPVYVVLGAYEARGRAVPAREWFDVLEAPSKELVVFERSGHRPSFEQPAEFVTLMKRVASETYGAN